MRWVEEVGERRGLRSEVGERREWRSEMGERRGLTDGVDVNKQRSAMGTCLHADQWHSEICKECVQGLCIVTSD